MSHSQNRQYAVVVENLPSADMRLTTSDVYDREIEIRDLYEDPATGAEHYLIRYPPGLRTRLHRHSAAHTIVVLSGHLDIGDGRVIGPGSYAHFPAGLPMTHAPAGDGPCLFVIAFDGPVDAEVLDS
jgi:quercetin dioxygenase-like cupin family protein